jgi:hypothetical protein
MHWPGLVAQSDTTLVKSLGIPTTYDPATGPAISVAGIFDAAYVRVEAGEAGVSSAGPAVFYRLGTSSAVVTSGGIDYLLELPVDPENDDPTITINGVEYQVVEVKKDGQGGVLLQLHLR